MDLIEISIAIIIALLMGGMLIDTFIFYDIRYKRKAEKELEKKKEEMAKRPKPTYVLDSLFPDKETADKVLEILKKEK